VPRRFAFWLSRTDMPVHDAGPHADQPWKAFGAGRSDGSSATTRQSWPASPTRRPRTRWCTSRSLAADWYRGSAGPSIGAAVPCPLCSPSACRP